VAVYALAPDETKTKDLSSPSRNGGLNPHVWSQGNKRPLQLLRTLRRVNVARLKYLVRRMVDGVRVDIDYSSRSRRLRGTKATLVQEIGNSAPGE
jgi:hypothetical protein